MNDKNYFFFSLFFFFIQYQWTGAATHTLSLGTENEETEQNNREREQYAHTANVYIQNYSTKNPVQWHAILTQYVDLKVYLYFFDLMIVSMTERPRVTSLFRQFWPSLKRNFHFHFQFFRKKFEKKNRSFTFDDEGEIVFFSHHRGLKIVCH